MRAGEVDGRDTSASAAALVILSLLPTLLGTYGDGGNATVLAQRCRWRGVPVQVLSVEAGDAVPAGGDVYLLGGGEDGAQVAAAEALRAHARTLAGALDRGSQLLAVCARMVLGPGVRPLGRVLRGVGNGPGAVTGPAQEGAVSDGVVATYLHGPVLARNAALADLLLARAMGCAVSELAEIHVPEHAVLRRLLGVES